jgi:hypothetical protein
VSSVWNNNALQMALQQVVNQSPPSPANMVLRLFTNAISPANTDLITAYTQCTDSMYSAFTMIGATWVQSSITGGLQMAYPSHNFLFAGTQTLYGWYTTDAAGTIVIAAGNWPSGPIVIPSGGGTLGVQVTLPAITP